jgi:hypothetical protein
MCLGVTEHPQRHWLRWFELNGEIKSQQFAHPLMLRDRIQSLIKQKFEAVVVSVD